MPTRRTVLAWVAGGISLTAVAACAPDSSDELSQAANSGNDQGYVSGSGVISQVPAKDRGKPLDLTFTTLDNKTSSLADARPKPVVINLWYAACPPCRKEAPDLIEVAEQYHDSAVFLGVNVRDQAAAANAFITTFNVPYANMLDSNGDMVSLLSGVLPPQATPSTVVLDAQGRAAARVVGAVDASTLKGLIDDVLAE